MRRGAAARTRTCRAGQRIETCAYRVRGKPRALARSSEAAVSTDSKATPRGGNVAVTQKGSCAAAVIAETVIAGAVIDKGSASAARPMNHHTV